MKRARAQSPSQVEKKNAKQTEEPLSEEESYDEEN